MNDSVFAIPSTLVGQTGTVIRRNNTTDASKLGDSSSFHTMGRSMSSTSKKTRKNPNDLYNCFTCGTPILKHDEFKMIEINEFKFHEDCCKCNSCMKILENEMYCENDAPFCTECYTDLFSYDCLVCSKAIISGIKMSYLGNYYHHDCFKCVACGTSLAGNETKAVFQGKLYCKSCEQTAINNNSRYVCDLCHLVIHTQPLRYIDIYGKVLRVHPHHLRCRLCERKLDSFGQVDGNSAICARCSQDDKAKPCYVCGKIPNHRMIKFYGRVYHVECFNCVKCNTKLTNDPKAFNSEPYCGPCFTLHAKQRCSGCHMLDCNLKQYKILEKRWGEDHIFCYRCNKTIPLTMKRGYLNIDLNIYCRPCFDKTKSVHHYKDSSQVNKMAKYMTIRHGTAK